MKRKIHVNGFLLLVVLVLTACSLPPSTSSGNRQSKKTLKDPEFKLNPNPKRAYTITVEVVDPPGEFGYIEAGALYKNQNAECSSNNNPLGYTNYFRYDAPIELAKVSSNVYKGIVYLDRMVDEDYYGKGLCIWALESIGVTFKRSDQKADTRFSPYMFLNDVIREENFTYYFWKKRYPIVDKFPDGWLADAKLRPDEFASHIKDDEIFQIKIASKKGVD